MEKMEPDESPEIFQECKDSLNDLNLEFETEKGSLDENKDFDNCKQTNNNHHIVHVGVIIVLLTIYLGTISVQQCLVSCVENASITEQLKQHKNKLVNYLQDKEKIENNKILERLLEYKDICKDLEIFTKATERKRQEEQVEDEDYTKEILKDIEAASGDTEEDNSMEYEDSSGSSGNDNCAQANRNKPKKSKYSIKTTETKNGFNKHNKSTKFKYQKNQKKDLNLNKKNSTAEPIIYLFALVFIYLLLKAASDINQHYKTQNKNDKRLRRCSLQSYAQTHRPDRRASKELALKHKQQQLKQRLKSLARSSSQDQPNYNYNHPHQQQQQHLMEGLIQNSLEQTQHASRVSPKLPNVSYSNNWQLLRQHTTTQSVDNSDIVNSARGNAEISSSMLARRCSVPAALSYQKQKFSTPSPLSIVNDHVNLNVSSSRRTSITSSMDSNESLAPEVKRRVRMINRH